MVTFQEAKLNAGLRQIYLDELVSAQFQATGAPNYLGKVIYDHNKQELFNYAKSLFPDAQEGEIALMLRTQGMNSDFNVFSRIDSYGDKVPRHVFVASQAFEVSEAEFKSELFDHELEHCRLQYEGITYPTLSKNLSPLSPVYVTSDGIGLIEELIAYTNEYEGLGKWGIDTEEKRKEIVSNMKQYIHALRMVANEGNEYVRIFSEPIINGFLSYLNWQVPEAFKTEVVAPQKKDTWKKWFFKKIGVK